MAPSASPGLPPPPPPPPPLLPQPLPADLIGKGPPHGKLVIAITVLLFIPAVLAVGLR
jgi:hypothetical protein